MKRLIPLLLSAFVLTSSGCVLDASGRTAQGTFMRALTVTGPVDLDLATGSGEVIVRTGDAGTVTVVGRVSAGWRFWDEDDAADRLREVQNMPPIEQSGNDIRIGRWPRWNNVRISYLVTVPAETELRVRTGSGDVEVGDLRGPVSAETGSGEIRLGRIAGEVRARTGSGDVELTGGTAANIRTGSGRVRMRVEGDGRVEVTTGSGDVELEGPTGPLSVRTGSGRISVVGDPKNDWQLTAGSGDLDVEAPETAGFTVDLRSSSGDIDVRDITASERSNRRELRGRVGGGGPLVSMSTGSGRIRIR